jgi:hypothetical protein
LLPIGLRFAMAGCSGKGEQLSLHSFTSDVRMNTVREQTILRLTCRFLAQAYL